MNGQYNDSEYIEYQLDEETTIYIKPMELSKPAEDIPSSGMCEVAWHESEYRAQFYNESHFDKITKDAVKLSKNIFGKAREEWKDASDGPDELEISFSFAIGTDANLILVNGSMEACIGITAHWYKK